MMVLKRRIRIGLFWMVHFEEVAHSHGAGTDGEAEGTLWAEAFSVAGGWMAFM